METISAVLDGKLVSFQVESRNSKKAPANDQKPVWVKAEFPPCQDPYSGARMEFIMPTVEEVKEFLS
jgi:hypothetical protein